MVEALINERASLENVITKVNSERSIGERKGDSKGGNRQTQTIQLSLRTGRLTTMQGVNLGKVYTEEIEDNIRSEDKNHPGRQSI